MTGDGKPMHDIERIIAVDDPAWPRLQQALAAGRYAGLSLALWVLGCERSLPEAGRGLRSWRRRGVRLMRWRCLERRDRPIELG